MKIELEPLDIQDIAEKVVELLKPYLSRKQIGKRILSLTYLDYASIFMLPQNGFMNGHT